VSADTAVELVRAALVAAVEVARQGATGTPRVEPPRRIRPFLGFRQLSSAALRAVRGALDEDEEFRSRVRDATTEAAVGRAGWLLLDRPDGWRSELAALEAEHAGEAIVARVGADERNTTRRLAGVEAALRRAQDRIAVLDEALASAQRSLTDERRLRRSAQNDRAAALDRARALESERDAAHGRVANADAEIARLRTEVAAAAASPPPRPRSSDPAPPQRTERVPTGRLPTALPPARFEEEIETAVFLVRQAKVLLVVDGYNASLQRWPELSIAEQRQRLLDAAAALAARTGAEIHVVFDGAEEVGRSAVPRRDLRVTFTPAGLEADDVIIDLIERAPSHRPVVAASDDRRLRRNAAAAGANVITQHQLFGLLGGET
jgi:predicted RNA-binding protein with PIN domain